MIKAWTIILDNDGTCRILTGEEAEKQNFNHWGNACVWLQKECEKFVAEQRMERSIKAKAEMDRNIT